MKIIFKPLFQKYLLYCFKNTLVVSFIIFLEQICIFSSILNSLIGLLNGFANEEIKKFFEIISKISPINFVKNSLECQNYHESNVIICTANSLIFLFQILTTIIIIIFFGIFIGQEIIQNYRSEDNTAEKLNDKQSISDWLVNLFTYFFVNFLDFVIHFCSLGIFYLNFNEIFGFLNIINSIHNNNGIAVRSTNIGITNWIMPFICVLFLLFYIYIYITFIKNINLIIQYNKELSTHYDHIFSVKYDLMNFFIKILISLAFAFDTNKIISERSLLFLKISIVFVFCFFNLYLIYFNLIIKKILYLANHKYNIFRIFLSYFNFFSISFIICFHQIFFQNFYLLYICFFIGFIVACFLAAVTNDRNYIAIYSSDNYILQLIYILNVKYNASEKELNSEVSNVMFHHKNYCIYYEFCQICKLESFDFDNFLFNFYFRIKQVLKNKNTTYTLFEKYDINTFDIIKLLIIENLDQNKVIKLIYKARRILEKYEVRKRYDNNYFNILIYNNYMKKLITKNQVLKFKIIQCYEDTSLHINEALGIIETMLLSLNNGEKHLFGKSSDLYLMKDKISKNVLFLSYYQNYFVDTYSIIIYRFIYKNIFNCDINDYVTIYNFEEIKDLINYMYNNEKLIQIKLNFNNNSMKLLRLGKDLIQYRNKSFEDLIPIDFKEHCCQELIRRVKSSENEENKNFEYIIIDSDNNLRSLKINFTILASFKLDEVILIGQYEINNDNLILLKSKLSNNYSGMKSNPNEYYKLQENISLGKETIDNNRIISNMDSTIADFYTQNINKNNSNIKVTKGIIKTNINKSKFSTNEPKRTNYISHNDDNNSGSLNENKNARFKSDHISKKNLKHHKKSVIPSRIDRDENKFYNENNFHQIFGHGDKTKDDAEKKISNSFLSQNVNIVYFSSNLQSAFFIKSNWLSKIKIKYSLPFSDIFELINSNINRPQEEKNKNGFFTICAINYDKYYTIYQKMLNFVEEEMNSEEIKENFKRFRQISKYNKRVFYKFQFLYEIKIKKKEVLYLLFKIRELKNDDKEMGFINNETFSINKTKMEADDLEAFEENEMDKLNSIMKEKDNHSITISSNTISATSKQDLMMEQDTSRKTIANNDQRMNKFTIFSLIFCIFLVIYCLFFLLMGMINNNNIRKLYLIRNNFNDFRYFFYHTSMNFFFNLEIDKNNLEYQESTTSESNTNYTFVGKNKNIESLFFQKFKDNKSININISKYILEELSVKLNILRNIYVNLQNAIYSSHYKDSLDVIFNYKTKFLQINTISSEISVSFSEKYFFETINIFFNHGKVIIDSISDNNYIYLSIINAKNNNIKFGDISTKKKSLNEVQIKMYEIILNYIIYYKNFIEIGKLMNKFFSDSLNDVFNSTYLLSFILMGIHLFLFIGGIFIVQFLHKIISQNDKMLSSSNDEGNIKFMREKLKCIKNLNLLFVENPRNLVNTINKKRAEFIKKKYAEAEKRKGFAKNKKSNNIYDNFGYEKSVSIENPFMDEKNILSLDNTNDNNNTYPANSKNKVSYLDKFVILIPFVQLVMIMFVLYYLYSLIFYFIFRNSYNDFILTSDFSNKNTELDNKMMNNINLLSTMMLLNKTEFDVSYDLTGKENKLMMELLTNILETRTEITKYKNSNIKFISIDEYEKNLMNCTYIYNNLNDTIFFELSKLESSKTFFDSLVGICNSYSFMRSGRIDSIFDEISYNSLHLYQLYDTSNKTYLDIVKIYENSMLYDVFLIFIIIFRPIRKFSSDYIYNNIIILSSNNYLVFTIVYLILNILVDLFIFYIINRLVVKKISDINKHLNNMITCISFKFSNSNKEKGE